MARELRRGLYFLMLFKCIISKYTMPQHFDILIIGSGPGGESVAQNLKDSGKKIAIVDYLYGGTCALRGCTPKRAMEAVTTTYWHAMQQVDKGFSKPEFVNWRQLMAHKQRFTAPIPANSKRKFRQMGLTVFNDWVRFTGKHTLVIGEGDRAETVQADKIVIATGAHPIKLDIPGNEYLYTSADFLDLPELPESVVFVGGGYVAFELAHIAAAAGAHVTILSSDEKPLGHFDPNLVDQLCQAVWAKGIDLRLGARATQVTPKADGSFEVTAQSKKGEHDLTINAQLVVNTAGRTPCIEKLDLDQAGVDFHSKDGISVNSRLKSTTQPHIYALGDVINKLPFTPVASQEGKVVAHNLLHDKSKQIDYGPVPFVTFTYPRLAAVGQQESDLKAAGIPYEVQESSIDDHLLEKAIGNDYAQYRSFIDPETKKVLGFHLLSSHAEEVINLAALLIGEGITIDRFTDYILAYPTAGQNLQGYV